jgi:hypothetical protein
MIHILGEYCHLERNEEDGQYYMKFRFPEKFNVDKNKSSFSFPCNSICMFKLSRPHAGCFRCRLRAAYVGKIPKEIRVAPYTIWLWQDRPHAKIKNVLFGLVATFLEILASM